MPLSESFDKKITEDERAEGYSVYTEYAEAVLLHKIHKEVDNKHRHEEGYNDTDEQKNELKGRRSKALKDEFCHLKERSAEHNGNRQEEGELSRRGTGYAREHTS